MNIFFLDRNPEKCAKYHNNKHTVKMPLELCQILCTNIILLGGSAPYRKTHMNHPSTIWARKSIQHWNFTKQLAKELCKEYTYRYGKRHKSEDVLDSLEDPDIPDNGWSDPPQAMPDHCKMPDVVEAYRKYYQTEKVKLAEWKHREVPEWFELKG